MVMNALISSPSSLHRTGRIQAKFNELRMAGRGGLITFITAGDPDLTTSQALLNGLAEAGADLIELGMPFSDPMADGPAIQQASLRALKAGQTMAKTFAMIRELRAQDQITPLILMGYYNPVYQYGIERFTKDAATFGVDGLILVDLPPEEADELLPHTQANGIDLIRLTTPTSDDTRLPNILKDSDGFVYYVSVLGITGTHSATATTIETALARLRRHTDLPIAIGFGIKTPQAAAEISQQAEAAVVGSAIVDHIAANLDQNDLPQAELVVSVLNFIRRLAMAVRKIQIS